MTTLPDQLQAGVTTLGLAAAESESRTSLHDYVTALSGTLQTVTMPHVLSPNHGMIIPLYLYPNNPYSDAQMQRLLGLIRQYHSVPTICVVNPSSGPGTVVDGNYTALIKLLRAAGALVVGYVSTAYAARAASAVKADVQRWSAMYGTLDGIFLDELPYDPGTGNANVTLYAGYYSYCKSLGYGLVVANPGTNEQGVWYRGTVADIIVTWETNSWPAESDLAGNFVDGHTDFDWRYNAILVYGQSTLDTAKLATMRKYAKWLYISNDSNPNPWDSLSSYLEALYAALNTGLAAASSVQIGGNMFITQMATGDTWITINASWDGTNWNRLDVTKYAYAMFLSPYTDIVGETGNTGILFLRAQPHANPINSSWWVTYGWENMLILDQFRHIILGGQGIEVDGSGTFPYGRFTHAGSPVRTGIATNIFVDFSGVDDNTNPSWFIGRKGDGAIIERAVAGSTSLAQLWAVNNVGAITENAASVVGAGSPGTALLAAVNIVTSVAGGANVQLATAASAGQKQVVVNTTASNVTVNPPASGTVAGAATVTMATNTSRTFYASASNVWW